MVGLAELKFHENWFTRATFVHYSITMKKSILSTETTVKLS